MTDRTKTFSAWLELTDKSIYEWISMIRIRENNDNEQSDPFAMSTDNTGSNMNSYSKKNHLNGTDSPKNDANAILLLFCGQVSDLK